MSAWRASGLLVAALLQGASNAAMPEVTWVTTELTTDTTDLGSAYLSFLIGRLPGFDHRVLHGSVGRVWHEIASSRSGACVLNALKTPDRQRLALFSRRPLLTRGYQLYFLSSRRDAIASYLDGEGQVDLHKLAGAPLRGGFNVSRAYNPAIDDFIAADQQSRHLNGIVSTRQLLTLLRSGRIDYIFAAPVDFGGVLDGLGSAAIAGGEGWSATFIACTNDETGRSVIASIDRLFDDQQSWAEFIEPLRRVLPPEDYAVALRSKP